MSSRFGNRSTVTALATALAVTVSFVTVASPPSQATPSQGAHPAAAAPADLVSERPDAVSAMVTARAQGHRVEDVSKRTDTTKVYANPDGTWTGDSNTEPVRTQDDDGDWHDIDTTLVAKDGGFAPRNTASDVVLSNGGDKTFAAMTEDGQDLSWRWPSVLPAPDIDGDTAIYHGAVSGGDLVVTALPTGFSHSIVLNQRPTDSVDITLPVTTDGGKVVEKPSGELAVETASGHELVTAPQPLMYDAAAVDDSVPGDDSGAPVVDDTQTQPVDTEVGKTAAGIPTLTLSPDDAFLADPDTVYPVTIDPTWTSGTTGDTYVMNVGQSTSASSETSLRVGTDDSGTHVRRSFLHFDSLNWNSSQHITSAKLILNNWNSASCAGANIRMSRVTQDWTTGGITWANQPSVSTDSDVDFFPAYGLEPSCANGDASWNVTNLFTGWANGTIPNYGVRLKAVSETSNAGYRSYVSANYNGGGDPNRPRIVWNYNTYPDTATTPTVAPSAAYTPAAGTPGSYSSTTTPTFSAKANDADGGTVALKFEVRATASATATLVASCTSSYVASNATASCKPSTALTNNTAYYVRTKAYDGTDWAGTSQTATAGWSSWTKVVIATTKPALPVITCPGHANGSWDDNPPTANVTCTITATATGASAPSKIHYSVNGAADTAVAIPQSSDPTVAKTSVSVSKAAGGYDVKASSESPAGVKSDSQDYQFGYGHLGLASPAADPLSITTSTVALDASGPPASGTPTAKVQWRLAASQQDAFTGWNDATGANLTVTNNATSGVRVTGSWDTTTATHDAYAGGSGGTDLDPRTPALLEIQVCVTYTSGAQCTWSTNPRKVMRVAHAFGDGFPTADAGPGQVALWTGEFNTNNTDVSVPGYTGDLSLSRSASTYAGIHTTAGGVFGPGWTAQFDGPDAGLAGMQLMDSTRNDGTLFLQDGDGSVMVFGPHAGLQRRTTAVLASGAWDALDEDTQLSGTTANVTVTSPGTTSQATTVVFTEADGTKSTFKAGKEPTATGDGGFVPASINEPGSQGVTNFDYDTSGRVTRIWQAPADTTCPAGALVAGCRVLRIDYASDSTTISGEAPGQVRGVWMDIYNSDKVGGPGMDSSKVAAYTYDTTHRLTSVTDPRSNLTISYTYDGTSSRLASLTPAGMKPINLIYGGSDHRLVNVTRQRPADDTTGGTATLASVVYDVPVTGNVALPSMSSSTVAAWGQTVTPTYAAAVFGPDKPETPATTGSLITPTQVSPGDWPYAELSYTDARGYTINTATNGAGDWQLTSTTYDAFGNVIRQLDEGDIAAVESSQVSAADAGTTTIYNGDLKDSNGNVILPAGSVVTDIYGPVRQAVVADGSIANVRPHLHTDYDQGAPNNGVVPSTGQAYALPTTDTTTAVDPATLATVQTISTIKTGYDPIVNGDTSGWTLGQPTSSTTVMAGNASDITTRTRYDAQGRVIETRQPKSDGTDAGTRRTSYYTLHRRSNH